MQTTIESTTSVIEQWAVKTEAGRPQGDVAICEGMQVEAGLLQTLPSIMSRALAEFGMVRSYLSLPVAEQKGYVQWVSGASSEETRRCRVAQMLDDLEAKHLPACIAICRPCW